MQSTKGVKNGKREKETGDLNSIEYLNFFCLRGCFFLKLLGNVEGFFFSFRCCVYIFPIRRISFIYLALFRGDWEDKAAEECFRLKLGSPNWLLLHQCESLNNSYFRIH